MTSDKPPFEPPSAAALARDWQTIWRSEMQALAVDREVTDMIGAAAQAWAGRFAVMQAASDSARSLLAGAIPPSGTDAPPRTTAAAAAPDPRDGIVERLEQRVAELERRLTERDAGGC